MEDILELERHYIETHNLQADWDHWVRMPSWQVNEGVLLINDLEPSIALTEGLSLLREGANKGFPSFVRVDKQFKVIEQAMEANELSVRNPPLFFLNWCKDQNFEVIEEFYFLVQTEEMRFEKYQRDKDVSKSTQDGQKYQRAIENRECIIYLLYKLLQNQNKNWTQQRVTQELIEKYSDKVGPNKGLSETTLKVIVSSGRKHLEGK